MKKIQRLIMFVSMFLIVGLGQAIGLDPTNICPADITLSSNANYTDTELTGLAPAIGINGQVDVEFPDIIINLDGNWNQTWGTVTVVDGAESTMQCITLSTAVLNQFGTTTLHAEDFLLNPDDFDSVTMSTSQNGPYTETIDFDCVNYDVNTPFDIFIKAGNDVETSTCIVSLILEDNFGPIAIVNNDITTK